MKITSKQKAESYHLLGIQCTALGPIRDSQTHRPGRVDVFSGSVWRSLCTDTQTHAYTNTHHTHTQTFIRITYKHTDTKNTQIHTTYITYTQRYKTHVAAFYIKINFSNLLVFVRNEHLKSDHFLSSCQTGKSEENCLLIEK